MSTMLSWHRPGQKVALNHHSTGRWLTDKSELVSGPVHDRIYEITHVVLDDGFLFFGLVGFGEFEIFDARSFRPVYPEIVDQLRNMTVPTDTREPAHV